MEQILLKTRLSHMGKTVFGKTQYDFTKGTTYPAIWVNLVTSYNRATALVNGAEKQTLSM